MFDLLKNNTISIKEFGLGFIQLKMTESKVVNVYTDKVKKFDNYKSPHNHQRNFMSFILNGELTEQLYEVSVNENGIGAFCGCGNVDQEIHEKYEVSTGHVLVHSKDDYYLRQKETFHTVEAKDGTITLVIKNLIKPKHDAIVIGEKGEEYISKYSESELWSIVEEYFDVDILSKIVEKQE